MIRQEVKRLSEDGKEERSRSAPLLFLVLLRRAMEGDTLCEGDDDSTEGPYIKESCRPKKKKVEK